MSEYVLPATGSNCAMNAGAASASTQRIIAASDSPEVTSVASIDTKTPSLGQALAASSVPVVLPALQEGLFGALTETAPATDTASSGLNGRLQRVAQRLSSIIALLPASLGGKARASAFAVTLSDEEQLLVGSMTESAPATDTASSGLNGRLQRIAQRITAMFGTAGTPTANVLSVQGVSSGTALTVSASAATVDSITAKLATDTIQNGLTALTPKFASIAASSSGNNTVVAAVSGKKIRVLSYTLVAAGAVTAAFQDGAGGTAKTGTMSFGANGGITVPFSPVGHFETTATTLLNLSLGGAVSVAGHICYVEV